MPLMHVGGQKLFDATATAVTDLAAATQHDFLMPNNTVQRATAGSDYEQNCFHEVDLLQGLVDRCFIQAYFTVAAATGAGVITANTGSIVQPHVFGFPVVAGLTGFDLPVGVTQTLTADVNIAGFLRISGGLALAARSTDRGATVPIHEIAPDLATAGGIAATEGVLRGGLFIPDGTAPVAGDTQQWMFEVCRPSHYSLDGGQTGVAASSLRSNGVEGLTKIWMALKVITVSSAAVTGITVTGKVFAHFFREVSAVMDDEAHKPHRINYLS